MKTSVRSAYILTAFLIILSIVYSTNINAVERVSGVIHLDTGISDGVLSPEEMVEKVKEKGLKVAIITDKDNLKVEYGISPLRKIIKKIEEKSSIMTFGAKNYLGMIEDIAKQNPDMTIIAGVEAIPFYYWDGSYFDHNLKLINFHKHLLVIGLETPEDLEGIPSTGYNNPMVFDLRCLLNIWPIFLIPAGLWLALYRKNELVKLRMISFTKERRPFRILGVVILLAGVLFLINNIPFCAPLYDQYNGDRGSLPYQNLIDYVEKKGGMVFWAHPDVEGKHELNGIGIYTSPYYKELLETFNYTGFAAFTEGMKYSGKPGGVWDMTLNQYINGHRQKPVWVIGELDYKEGNWMGETQTVFLVNGNNKSEILKAMRTGRMYAVHGDSKPVLEAFQIWDDEHDVWTEMGGNATVSNAIRLKIKLRLSEEDRRNTRLRLIREGIVIKEFTIDSSLDIELTDDYFRSGERTYYRIDIDNRLISNPVFVTMKGNSQ